MAAAVAVRADPSTAIPEQCLVPGCDRPVHSRHLCQRCYSRQRRQGTLGLQPKYDHPPELLARVERAREEWLATPWRELDDERGRLDRLSSLLEALGPEAVSSLRRQAARPGHRVFEDAK